MTNYSGNSKPGKQYSITRRLVWMVLLVELASALSVTSMAWLYERHAHFRAFDVRLRGRADSVLGAVQDSDDKNDDVILDGTQASSPSEDIYEVDDPGGRVLGKSANWFGPKDLEMRPAHRDTRNQSDVVDVAFASLRLGDEPYRVIRIGGVRIVDPGEPGGGVHRYVTVYYGSPVNRVWSAVLRAVAFYAASSLVVMAITGVLMSWLLRRGLAPLRELAGAAGRVSASSWSFSPPQSARLTYELSPLVTTLETLLLSLEQSFDQQKRFVGDAAHELKTGVALVKSSLQLLSMKPRSQSEYQAGLERCLVDCIRMEEMVMQMLTLARLEDSPVVASRQGVLNLRTTVEAVVDQLDPMMQIREISIVIEETPPDGEPVQVRAGKDELKLLFSNLLMNAIQHSPAKSAINVSIRKSGEVAEVEIHDQGDGIAPADLPFIFERFSRGDPSRSRNTGGAGLGLAICKAITTRLNGTIQIESDIRSGTFVLIALPLAQEQATVAIP